MRARTYVADTLRAALPKTWRVVDSETTLDRLSSITVRVSNQRIKRLDAAPAGAYDTTLMVTLISPNADFAKAEGELEDALDVLVEAIEDQFGTAWDEASKVLHGPDGGPYNLAWDVPLHVYLSRED